MIDPNKLTRPEREALNEFIAAHADFLRHDALDSRDSVVATRYENARANMKTFPVFVDAGFDS